MENFITERNYTSKTTRGHIIKERWISLCKVHEKHNENCTMCTAGRWYKSYIITIEMFMWRKVPNIWLIVKKLFGS